jgi:hypothetical protein
VDEKYILKIDEKPRDSTRGTQEERKMKDMRKKIIYNLVGICVIRWLKKGGVNI